MENDLHHVFQLFFPASALGPEAAAEEGVSCAGGELCSLCGQRMAKSPAATRSPARPLGTAAAGPPQELPALPPTGFCWEAFRKHLAK